MNRLAAEKKSLPEDKMAKGIKWSHLKPHP